MRSLLACILAAFLTLVGMSFGSEIDSVEALLKEQQHRSPGSAPFTQAQDMIAAVLTRAGLTVHRQHYLTQVPRTVTCTLTVDGAAVEGIYPLGPNGIVPVTTGGRALSGPLVYVGGASLPELEGMKLKGAIALVDFSSRYMKNVFLQGAQAVIFVEDGEATQWSAASHFSVLPFAVPRAWMARQEAESRGWLKQRGVVASEAAINLAVVWEDRITSNLWALLPGEKGAEFNLNSEEAMVLSADLSTSGAVPDLTPGHRDGANALLLTRVASDLASFKPKRSLLFLYTGSHYGLHDGMRTFYYAYEKQVNRFRETDSLKVRGQFFANETEELKARFQVASAEDFFSMKGQAGYDVILQEIKRSLRSKVSGYNFHLLELTGQRRRIPEENREEREQIQQVIEKTTTEKKIWNDLQRQVSEEVILKGHLAKVPVADGEDDNLTWFRRLTGETATQLQRSIEEAQVRLNCNQDHQVLSDVLAGKRIVVHLSFDFASEETPWLLNATGESLALTAKLEPGSYSKMLGGIGRVYREAGVDFGKAPLYLPATEPQITPEFLTTPRSRLLSSTVSTGVKVNGYNLSSLGNPLNHDQLPEEPKVSLSGLSKPLGAFLRVLADSPELSLSSALPDTQFNRNVRYLWDNGQPGGLLFRTLQRGSADAEGPSVGAMAYIYTATANSRHPLVGYSLGAIARVNSYGFIDVPNISSRIGGILGIDFDQNGVVTKISGAPSSTLYGTKVNLFYTQGGGIYRYDFPVRYDLVSPEEGALLNGKNDSNFKNKLLLNSLDETVIYKDRIGDSKLIVNGVFLTGATEENYKGEGLRVDSASALGMDSSSMAIHDYTLLNGHRFNAFKSKGIINNSLALLDAERNEHVEEASVAIEKGNIAAYRAHQSFALTLAQRAYGPLRTTSNEMVSAVVILMMLILPFAFSMERLLFGFTSIYKQVCGFVGIFLLTFSILYKVHPAFSLADAPLVIFLAFVIILMSAMVIYIVMGKFKVEIKAMQGLVSKAHNASKESSTALASILIGISGMRNRPLKTFLTATTIILLTFTILVFASFESQLGVVETYLGGGIGVDRIEVHRPSYLRIPDSIINALSAGYGESYEVFERKAGFNDPFRLKIVEAPARTSYALSLKNGKVTVLSGAMGFDPREIAINPDLQKLLGPLAAGEKVDGRWPLMLPDLIVKGLEIQIGDPLSIRGVDFTLIGTFEGSKLDGLASVEGSKIIPPDYLATMADDTNAGNATPESLASSLETLDVNSFLWLSPSLIAVCPNGAMEELDHYTNYVTLYPRGNENIGRTAGTISQLFKGPVFAKDAVGARKYFYTASVQGSGFGEVIVPLLLGGLIIFSSLMGSIVDREREIFTFSALGLSPPDVGTLFFAESAVYSVLGGVGGYLFSQVVAKFLILLSQYGIFYPPEMNFSSLSSIYTILIVMALVMLSTIYPAIKAGKSANPGVARKWQMPEPVGTRMKFVFPFTVSTHDLTGVLSFIKEHFDCHGDASLGSFAAQNVRIFQRENAEMESGRSLGLKMEMALSPFDLGLFQHFEMYSQDSDIPGIMEVVIELDRTAGALSPWLRSNRNFIDDLRNQFLLWRSLPVETVEHYCSLTEASLATH